MSQTLGFERFTSTEKAELDAALLVIKDEFNDAWKAATEKEREAKEGIKYYNSAWFRASNTYIKEMRMAEKACKKAEDEAIFKALKVSNARIYEENKTATAVANANPNVSRRGIFCVFEGIDRCGKSTQVNMLVEKLRDDGVIVNKMQFPNRETKIGMMLDGYLCSKAEVDDRCIHLLFSANRWEHRQDILDTVERGETIVCDRYAYSGAAFSAAKDMNGLDLAYCQASDRGLPLPDVVIYLEIDPGVAAKRGEYGVERYETLDMQHRVCEQYAHLRETDWCVINAARSPDEVHRDVLDCIRRTQNNPDLPKHLGQLWELDHK